MIRLIIVQVILFIALAAIDIGLTNGILALGGREKNPIMNLCMARLGRQWWWIPKMAATLIAASIAVCLPYGWIYLLVMIAAQAWVDYRNFGVLNMLRGR